jgi:hypothetical protein
MSVPKWVRSNVKKDVNKSLEKARGNESQVVQRMESMGLQQDVSEEKVTKILDNISQRHIEDFSSAFADEIYDGPSASTSSGQDIIADGGDWLFEHRDGRVYCVTASILNSAMVGVHLQSGQEIGALINSTVLIACFAVYLSNEYNVELKVQ